MKNLLRKIILFCLPILLILFSTCDITNNDDPCDDTVLSPSISVQLTCKLFLYEDDEKSDKEVMIAFDKFSCGDSEEPVPHGHFEFTGFMNSNDFFRSGIVGYNLRNKNDAIRVIYSYKDEYGFLPKKTVFLFPNDFNGLPLLELTETINL